MTIQPPSWYPPQRPVGAPGAGWSSLPPGVQPAAFPVPEQRPRPSPGRGGHDWRIGVMVVAVVLLVAAGVVVYVRGTGPSEPPRVQLERALVATSATGTAQLTMDIKASVAGVSISATASGTVDFDTQATSMRMSLLGQTLAFVETGDELYVKLDKVLTPAFPGKTWVRMPATAIANGHGSQLFVTDDPAEAMGALVRLGATIRPLGSRTIDGSQDQGYAISFSLANLKAHASELPASYRSIMATARSEPQTASVSTTMYVDSFGRLQAADVVVTARATGHPVSASIDMAMSQFGTAPAPVAPPATQTVTYQQVPGSLGSALPVTLPGTATATT